MNTVGEAVAGLPEATSAVAPPGPGPRVRIRNLSKCYRRADGSEARALDGVSFDVDAGQVVVLVGPQGCGHSTLLRAIAGLEAPDGGRVEIGGARHRVCLIPAHPALPDELTLFEIVAAPEPGVDGVGPVGRARRALGAVGLGQGTDRRPGELSGGQRQRVALARALAIAADVVLFDEPLSSVEPGERPGLRRELRALPRDLGFSAVVVTHDRSEALALADRLAVMEDGRIAQFGPPSEVYDRPASRRVAAATGTTNELTGLVCARDDAAGTVRVQTPVGPVTGRSGAWRPAVGDRVVALWRPERTRLSVVEPEESNRWLVTVDAALFLDEDTQQAARAAGHRFLVWQRGGGVRAGDRAWLAVAAGDVRVLPAEG